MPGLSGWRQVALPIEAPFSDCARAARVRALKIVKCRRVCEMLIDGPYLLLVVLHDHSYGK